MLHAFFVCLLSGWETVKWHSCLMHLGRPLTEEPWLFDGPRQQLVHYKWAFFSLRRALQPFAISFEVCSAITYLEKSFPRIVFCLHEVHGTSASWEWSYRKERNSNQSGSCRFTSFFNFDVEMHPGVVGVLLSAWCKGKSKTKQPSSIFLSLSRVGLSFFSVHRNPRHVRY